MGVDVKCPHCETWHTESWKTNKDKIVVTQTSYGFILKCGTCLLHSYWNCEIIPAPLQCDHTGTLISPGEVRQV